MSEGLIRMYKGTVLIILKSYNYDIHFINTKISWSDVNSNAFSDWLCRIQSQGLRTIET